MDAEVIRTPHSMRDLRNLTENLSAELLLVKAALNLATYPVPTRAAEAAVLLNSKTLRLPVRRGKATGACESACSAAEQALKEAADAVRAVYAEFKRAGIPEGAEW